MKIKIPGFDAINKTCPRAIQILKRYYNADAEKLLIRSHEMNCGDLKDVSDQLLQQMEGIVQAAENEDRGLTSEEQKAFEELKGWQARFAKVYDEEKPSNALPPETRSYVTDDLGNPSRPERAGSISHDANEPLRRDQKFSDWCQRHVKGEPVMDGVNLGGLVRTWLTGQGSESERRAMVSTGTGGLLIPSMLSGQIIDLLRDKSSVMRAGAQLQPMPAGNLTIARQVTDPEAAWRGELAHTRRTEATFEAVELKACSLSTILVISEELVQDSIGLQSFLTRVLSEAMAAELDRAALEGTGTLLDNKRIEPVGIMNTDGILEHSGALTSYGVFSEAHTLLASRNSTPTGLILSPSTLGVIDAWTDTTGQPLNAPSSWSRFEKYDTNKLDPADAVLGNFSQLVVGMTQNLQLDISNQASLPQDGSHAAVDLFSQHAIALRCTLRADVAALRPVEFCKLTLTTPARKKAA